MFFPRPHIILPAAAAAAPASVWDPANKGTQISLSQTVLANDTATNTVGGGTWSTVKCAQGRNTGVHYLEFEFLAGSTDDCMVGVADGTTGGGSSLDTFLGSFSNSAGSISSIGNTFVNGTGWSGTTISPAWGPLANNDIMQLLIDSTGANSPGNTIGFLGKNNTWLNSGNPVTGANPFITIPGTPILFPAISLLAPTSGSFVIKTVSSAFAFSPPAGASAWSP